MAKDKTPHVSEHALKALFGDAGKRERKAVAAYIGEFEKAYGLEKTQLVAVINAEAREVPHPIALDALKPKEIHAAVEHQIAHLVGHPVATRDAISRAGELPNSNKAVVGSHTAKYVRDCDGWQGAKTSGANRL